MRGTIAIPYSRCESYMVLRVNDGRHRPAITLSSTHVWFTVRPVCLVFQRQPAPLLWPSLHSPSSRVEYHVPFRVQACRHRNWSVKHARSW